MDQSPKIQLDPNRILIPILEWGPNNQIRGLMETMLLAIKMNRTLVVPPFFKHHFDLTLQIHGAHGTERDALEPEIRINPVALSRLISVIDIEQMRVQCNGHVDAVFRAKDECSGYNLSRLRHFSRFTGMEMFYTNKCELIHVSIVYKVDALTINYSPNEHCVHLRIRHDPMFLPVPS